MSNTSNTESLGTKTSSSDKNSTEKYRPGIENKTFKSSNNTAQSLSSNSKTSITSTNGTNSRKKLLNAQQLTITYDERAQEILDFNKNKAQTQIIKEKVYFYDILDVISLMLPVLKQYLIIK